MLTSKRVAVGLALWWLLVLVAEVQSYILELRRGAYPVDADSISIPIAAVVLGWLLASPFVAFLAWWLWRTPTVRFSWLALDRSRPIWCLVWSAVLGVLGLAGLWHAATILYGAPGNFAIAFAGGVLGLAARAGFCAPGTYSREAV